MQYCGETYMYEDVLFRQNSNNLEISPLFMKTQQNLSEMLEMLNFQTEIYNTSLKMGEISTVLFHQRHK